MTNHNCPTCGQAVPRSNNLRPVDFNIGDRVRHFSLDSYGYVTEIKDGVRVDFEDGVRGWYDTDWFKLHPNGLRIVAPNSNG